jgi:PKD repeat protein
MQAPCYLGHDEARLGLLSNGPLAGARSSIGIQLPADGLGAAQAIGGFEIALAVQGVPCSASGSSFLTVDLIPPFGGRLPSANPNWSAWAPVWDLVPAGGCDPQCQNGTALFTLSGTARRFCEEDAVVRGIGADRGAFGSFAPSDRLDLTFLGSSGSAQGISVYLNDTTHPAANLAWSYGASVTISGRPLTPLTNGSASGTTSWGPGASLSAIVLTCPTGGPVPLGCNSYNGPRNDATALPRIVSALSWNASQAGYADPYPWAAPASTSGGCSGLPGTAPCPGFTSFGGTGAYPYWGLRARGGNASWGFGGGGSDLVGGFGGAAQFNRSGVPGAPIPTEAISAVTNTTGGSTLSVTARVSDPSGISGVTLTSYYCDAGPNAVLTTASATEQPGATNGSTDGNFSASIHFTTNTHGSVYYWLTASSPMGAPTEPVRFRATMSSGGSACGFPNPAAPAFTSANVTAIGGGYRLSFNETAPAVVNYTLWIQPSGGGAAFSRDLRSTGPVNVIFGGDGRSWNLSLVAVDAAGRSSLPTVAVPAPPALGTLGLSLLAPAGTDYWQASDTVWFNASVSGGLAPFTFRFDFADGGSAGGTRSSGYLNLTHDFASFNGVALVSASVLDASGEPATAIPLGISVLAGPLGVNQSLSAGSNDVRLTWTPPASPGGPITGYTVFYTNRSENAPFVASIWPGNDSARGISLWNTTSTTFDSPNLPYDTVLYAIVVAWSSAGVGMLPEGWLGTPAAHTANLTPSEILLAPAGGPAPLTVSISDTVTAGTNTTLVEGLYSFNTNGSIPANISGNTSGPFAIWWLNTTWTFQSTGLQTVVLHITDAYSDTEIPVAFLYVGSAPAPSAVARVTSGTALVGSPVTFQVTASGGTGNYAYNWSFGDGGSATGAAPSHIYQSGGNFTALVEVTDTGDHLVSGALVNLTVYSLPKVSVRASAADSTGGAFNFTALVVGGLAPIVYSWTFGDGNTASGPSVTHVYTTPGVYEVNVSVTDLLHHTTQGQVTVVVPAPPTTVSGSSGGLSGTELAAFVVLGTVALLFLIGMVYYWNKSRALAEEEPPATREIVRARPPADPPDPS